MNNAPFSIGQKVVALKTSPYNHQGHQIIRGQQYTIEYQYFCESCKQWIVALKEMYYTGTWRVTKCCSTETSPTKCIGGPAKFFAPIQPRYSDITEELCKQVVIGDTTDAPVKIITN